MKNEQLVKVDCPSLFDPFVLFGYVSKKTDFGKHKIKITGRYARAFVKVPRFNWGSWACYVPFCSRTEGYWVSDFPYEESMWRFNLGDEIEIEDKYITEAKIEDLQKYEEASQSVLSNKRYLVRASPM